MRPKDVETKKSDDETIAHMTVDADGLPPLIKVMSFKSLIDNDESESDTDSDNEEEEEQGNEATVEAFPSLKDSVKRLPSSKSNKSILSPLNEEDETKSNFKNVHGIASSEFDAKSAREKLKVGKTVKVAELDALTNDDIKSPQRKKRRYNEKNVDKAPDSTCDKTIVDRVQVCTVDKVTK